MYEESKEDYIYDLSINFTYEDNNLIYIKKENYSIKSNIELLIKMSKSNKIKMQFKSGDKQYEYLYNINFDNNKIINDG